MKRIELFIILKNKNESVPKPLTLPTEDDINEIEKRLNVKLPNSLSTMRI